MADDGQARDRLGRFGVWRRSADVTPELARELERLGYGTVWLGGSPAGDLRIVDELLDATTTLTVATGIVNVWDSDAAEVARSYARIVARHPGRFLLGVGVGHREATAAYRSPFETLAGYVDTLLADGVPAADLVLAALGPRVLQLSAERTAGAHPYLVTPEHTRSARELVGAGPLLAPEHKVVLEADPDRARAIGRPPVARPYLGLTNYTTNLRRLGWTDADLADGGSDALIDALVAHGTADRVAAQLARHWDAGADHVAVQLLTAPDADLSAQYAELAAALRG
ncbi:LLM class F420-dependent oxidoreductase [Modestobacter sp. NPDC049651]|uniref:LLM class F420-dependent oxidoreductase n=1 Tax=unclassified Modestobacter TaxID=2643866 RepID=UPI0033E7BBDC